MIAQHQQHPAPGTTGRFANHRRLSVVACGTHGQPRTYRLAPSRGQESAYRRLAVAILGLDVTTLASELRWARQSAA